MHTNTPETNLSQPESQPRPLDAHEAQELIRVTGWLEQSGREPAEEQAEVIAGLLKQHEQAALNNEASLELSLVAAVQLGAASRDDDLRRRAERLQRYAVEAIDDPEIEDALDFAHRMVASANELYWQTGTEAASTGYINNEVERYCDRQRVASADDLPPSLTNRLILAAATAATIRDQGAAASNLQFALSRNIGAAVADN